MDVFRGAVTVVMILRGSRVGALVTLLVLGVIGLSPATTDVRIDPKEIVTLLPKDVIPAIREPSSLLVPAAAATGVRESDQVIGVVVDGEVRAYPINFLSWHEIVNDTVGGVPIAVTWCPLCYTGIVYGRQVNSQTLTFGVSGKLWANGLMMYDHQTGSLWSHTLGQAITGPMQGTMLRMLAATQTDWGTWKRLQPATLILDPTKSPYERDYNIDPYEGYYTSSDTGVIAVRREDARLDAKTLVLGVRLGAAVKVYPFSHLGQKKVVNDTVAEVPLLVVFQEKGATGIVFSRRVGAQTLSFVPLEKASDGLMTMRDAQTGSRWSAFKGIALEGPLQGAQLERLPSTYAFWFVWKDHYPETAVYGDDDAIDSTGGSP